MIHLSRRSFLVCDAVEAERIVEVSGNCKRVDHEVVVDQSDGKQTTNRYGRAADGLKNISTKNTKVHEGFFLLCLRVLRVSFYKPPPFKFAVTTEVDEDAHFHSGCFQVIKHLSLFVSRQTIHRL